MSNNILDDDQARVAELSPGWHHSATRSRALGNAPAPASVRVPAYSSIPDRQHTTVVYLPPGADADLLVQAASQNSLQRPGAYSNILFHSAPGCARAPQGPL